MAKPKVYIRFEIPLRSNRCLGFFKITIVEKSEEKDTRKIIQNRVANGYQHVKHISMEEFNEIYVKEYDVELVDPIYIPLF